jgi:hypothetical protein
MEVEQTAIASCKYTWKDTQSNGSLKERRLQTRPRRNPAAFPIEFTTTPTAVLFAKYVKKKHTLRRNKNKTLLDVPLAETRRC